MSGTRRVPINRRHTTPITPRAVELFVAMGRLRCSCGPPKSGTPYKLCAGCERWHNLQVELNNELRCRPWEWPCVSRQGPKHAGGTAWNERIAATMKALREAAKAQRAQEISANVDQPGAPVGPANA